MSEQNYYLAKYLKYKIKYLELNDSLTLDGGNKCKLMHYFKNGGNCVWCGIPKPPPTCTKDRKCKHQITGANNQHTFENNVCTKCRCSYNNNKKS